MLKTKEERRQIREQIRKKREVEAVIKNEMWKADQIARKISAMSGLPMDELRQQACEYILTIHKSWDPSKGANFSTWVNRNLSYHMFNYLRDNSRLVKIPRSYSDLNLKIRKLTRQNPNITTKEIAQHLNTTERKVENVREAFAMSFTEITEFNQLEEVENSELIEEPLEGFNTRYKDALFNIAKLPEEDETFLVDYIIKKRSTTTLLRKNPNLKNAKDIENHAKKLIRKILCKE